MNSVWAEEIKLPSFETLEGDIKTDVLIIGGGIAGILCAYFLKQQGVEYILAEKERICSWTTKNTTAKITAQHGLIYNSLLKSIGEEKAKMYLKANLEALEQYSKLCKDIECDFEIKDSFVYSIDNPKKLEKEARALLKIGYEPVMIKTDELPFDTAGAIGFKNQAQFHPLKFISAIAKDLKIYENTFVIGFSENTALTQRGKIYFKKLIFATHFPIDNKHGMYFLKMYQHRSYVIAFENAVKLNNMYVDEDKKGMSFRSYSNLLFVGGGGHRTGKKGGNFMELKKFGRKYYPNATEKYFWAAQDCMSLDKVPYIGRYSKAMPQCFVAAGFNKWGMTGAMAAAMLLSDMIMENKNPYSEVFLPDRNMIKPQLFLNATEAVINLCTISKKRCPHLGCALKWNRTEHSWDCPCHGSRFDKNGVLLNNPANGNLRI